MAQRILSLDLATRIGFAFGPIGGEPEFGAYTLPSTGDDIGEFVDAFDKWIDAIFPRTAPTLCVFESPILPRVTRAMTVRKLSVLPAFLEWRCRQSGIGVREIHLQSIKKFWTGRGNATKHEMTRAARALWDYPAISDAMDDEADALAGWWYAHGILAPEVKPLRSRE